MSEPFLAEIRMVGFNFAPKGWAFCDGQILPINQNQALYSLLGTTYGGDGRTSFALPDLRGRVPVHVGEGIQQGQKSGEETHNLSVSEMPNHTHLLNATSDNANANQASGNLYAKPAEKIHSSTITNLTPMHPSTVTNVGGGQAHENMQPYIVLNFVIALQGLFPSMN